MIRNLLVKELREHWLALGSLVVFSLLGLLLVALSVLLAGEAGNALEALRFFIITFGVIAALVICGRLVVREYNGKTQLFLESLPLTRGHMIAVKYTLGLAILFSLVVGALAALLPIVARHQPVTILFVEIVCARAFAFAFFIYSFFFVTGMLGRYRMAIYLGIVVGLLVLTMTTDMELRRFGPLELMNTRFAFERDHFPAGALSQTLTLGVAFSAIGFLLGLMREGSVAAMLAEKMSHREKVFVTAVFLGFLFVGSMFDKAQQKRPFDLPGAIVEESGGVTVKLSVGQLQDRQAGEVLAMQIHGELAAAVEYLGLAYSPPVFITTRRDLDANRYELGELVRGEGVLARVNFSAPEFDRDRFLAWLVREFLIEATDGRARLESKMWILDGFGPFWQRRRGVNVALADDRRLALRAVYGTTGGTGLSEVDLALWHSFRERVGEGVAAGVAWSGLDILARRYGPERSREFLRAVLASRAPDDARALWFEERNPIEEQFERHVGVPMTDFIAAWRNELDIARAALVNDLSRLPRVRGEVSFDALSADTWIARYRVAVDPQPEGPADASRITLLHANLSAGQTEVAPNDLLREDVDLTLNADGELPGTWTRGSRFYSTFSLEVPELGCEVISGWSRREIR
jgi:hypothetical protein